MAVPDLDSVTPQAQRVHDMITLRGTNFGPFTLGVSQVTFEDAERIVAAGVPYVWRDDFIQVRVPVGDLDGPIPKTPLNVVVTGIDGVSGGQEFQVITATEALSFRQRSLLDGTGFETSVFLGDPSLNMARTKDADFADVNGDGWPDLIDNNSNNLQNGTHSVLRLNRQRGFFRERAFEPNSKADVGQFLVTVEDGGTYIGDGVIYDADFIDLNNDELPDLVQAVAGSAALMRVLMNNHLGRPARFLEATNTWAPIQNFAGSPDDVDSADVNMDGFLDVAISYRFSDLARVWVNQGGASFASPIELSVPGSASIHDVFFLDGNDDGLPDVIPVNESGPTGLFVHNGDLVNPGFEFAGQINFAAVSGISADFNGDGVDDFALTSFTEVRVFLNDPDAPGTFTQVQLLDGVSFLYDLEAGDINLDGAIDLAAAIVNSNADDACRIYINNGDGTFFNATSPGAGDLLPQIGPYERLSADLVDYDLDGDLDLYLTGADGGGVIFFGQVANQFWENEILGLRLTTAGACPGDVTLTVSSAEPFSNVAFFASSATGTATIGAGNCADSPIDLRKANPVGFAAADENGVATLVVNLPDQVCGFSIQAVSTSTCGLSNLATPK